MLTALGALPQHRSLRRLNAGTALLSGNRVSGDRRGERFRTLLVGSQVALCTFLLVSGAQLVRVYREVLATPAGFEAQGLVAFNVTPPAARYRGQTEYLAFYDELLERIRAEPGVTASYTSLLPYDHDNWTEGMYRDGVPQVPEELHFVLFQRVEPSYDRVLGLPLLAGRDLTVADNEGAPRVGVVNEWLARRMFGLTDPIGEKIGSGDRWIEVVGEVGDKRHRDLSEEPLLELFVPRRQDTNVRSMWVVVRSAEDPSTLLPRLRELLRQVDPTIPFAYATIMTDRIELSILPQRFRSMLLGSLAVLALVLATLGVGGLASFRVSRQTREIGVRMALGMKPARARATVLGSALLTASLGVAAGIAFTFLCLTLVDTSRFGMPRIEGSPSSG